MTAHFFVWFFALLVSSCVVVVPGSPSSVPWSERQRTFSVTHKPGQPLRPGQPLVVCDLTSPTGEGSHVVLLSWFTGSVPWEGFEDTVVSYYLDGEGAPSINTTLGMLSGNGPVWPQSVGDRKLTPWGTSSSGVLAYGGGAYTSMRVPFASRVRVVATMARDQVALNKTRSLYSLIRGVWNFGPVVLPYSSLSLPPNFRLRSYETLMENVPAKTWVPLASISTGPGVVLMVTQHLRCGNAHSLEGTHRANITWASSSSSSTGGRGTKSESQRQGQGPSESGVGDPRPRRAAFLDEQLQQQQQHSAESSFLQDSSPNTTETIYLSSGFEDYYLSGQYFDAGQFATPISGMTAENRLLEPSTVTAFRYHEVDPVFFGTSLHLEWQNGRYDTGSLAAKACDRVQSLVLAYVAQEQ